MTSTAGETTLLGSSTAPPVRGWVLVVPSLDLLLAFNGRTPASKREAIDRTSLERLFAAVTQCYVARDGTVVNGG